MVKRIMLLGLAVAALAIALPAIVAQSGLGGDVAQAQTPPTTDPDDQADPPEAPDQADPPEAPDQADPPEAPDQADPPAAPETPDQGDTPGEDDEGSGDDEDDEDEEETPAPPSNRAAPEGSAPSGGNNAGGSESGNSGSNVPQTPQVRVSSQPVSGADTGEIPQGGIQAGAGGTVDEGSASALLLGSAALMLVLTAGGLVLRRRGFES
jgi:outer membrane biosynthesis protein TonB